MNLALPHLPIKSKLTVIILLLIHFPFSISEEYYSYHPPASGGTGSGAAVPIHNLIPRFKMPKGNLLRYQIPQWEVLYFLKYGIVPFVFYDPDFNKTNFVSQVQKFKMYFNDPRPSNRIPQNVLRDDESFKEFLRKHGYQLPLPGNALGRDNKLTEETDNMVEKENLADFSRNDDDSNGDKTTYRYPPVDLFMAYLKTQPKQKIRNRQISLSKKDPFPLFPSDSIQTTKGGLQRNFWNAFVNRYPLMWKYRRSWLIGAVNPTPDNQNEVTKEKDLGWAQSPLSHPYSYSYSYPNSFLAPSGLRRNTKSFRIGTRSGDPGGGTGGDDGTLGDDGREPKKNGKFQTQGWR